LSRREALKQASAKCRNPQAPEFWRAASDISIQCGLGSFFAAKLRAAALFSLYEQTKNRPALAEAVKAYGRARAAWVEFADEAEGVYRGDVTFGPGAFQRGHWQDRLAAIDTDIADMTKMLASAVADSEMKGVGNVAAAIKAVLSQPAACKIELPKDFHTPPAAFRRGEPLVIEALRPSSGAKRKLPAVVLHFRRVNQAEVWQALPMEAGRTAYRTSIPGAYADSPFPLQYYFEVRDGSEAALLFPGLTLECNCQPYFLVRAGEQANKL